MSKVTHRSVTAPFDPATCKAGCRDYRVHGIPQSYHEARCSGYINQFEAVASKPEGAARWECWTCAIKQHPDPWTYQTSHNTVNCACPAVPLRIYPQGGWLARHRAANHDVRPVTSK